MSNFKVAAFAACLCVTACCSAAFGTGTAWKKYNSVSCEGEGNPVVEDLGNQSLPNCQRLCLENGFGMFANWNNLSGHCVVYLYCDNPKCHTPFTTYHALRPHQKPWKMGCAAGPPGPAPTPPPPTPPSPSPAPPVPPPAVPGAWLRYDSVSCEGNGVVQDLGNRSLADCKRACMANGFGMFVNWDNATGHCIVYLYCDKPRCGNMTYSTYHALRGGQKQWDKGCASDPPAPAPKPQPPTPSPGLIVPCFDSSCVHWKDTEGNRIEAHAAGMLQAPNGRWYWYGESAKTPSLDHHGVNCYSAPDISGPWKNEGLVLSQSDIHVPGQTGPFIVERPKVLYNNKTAAYVMWFHLDLPGYKFAHTGVATATEPQGPFTFQHGLLPDGRTSEDMSLFRDPQDGQAYFIRSVANQYTAISRLTPDYLHSTGIISNHSVFEGMALFRHPNGTYYIVTSHLTGWGPNPLMLFRAAGKTLDDPQWVDMGNPTGDATSFNSQPTYVVQYTPHTGGDPYFVYMADNWLHSSSNKTGHAALIDAAYIWLPLWFKHDRIELHRQPAWELESPFPSCPTPGTPLFLSECGRGGQIWDVANGTGRLVLSGTELCVTYNNDASQAILGRCSSAPEFQWVGKMLRTATNPSHCLDIALCQDYVCAGAYVSLGQCNDAHGNQEFTIRPTSGGKAVLQSNMDESKCLTVCF